MAGTTDKARETLDRLAAEVESITTGEDWARMLDVAARFHDYSAGNVMLILAQRPDATRVAGFNTWKGLGRFVRKGERGIRILAPMVRKVERETADGETETGRAVTGFRSVAVFDISQTDGDPLPDVRPDRLTGDGDEAADAALRAWIGEQGYAVEVGELAGEANGMTDPAAKTVTLRAGLSGAQATKTLAHEAAHIALGHVDSLAGYAMHRGVCEVEAESVAHVVAAAVGIASDAYSFPYVAGWSGGDVAKVRAVADRVLKSARVLIAAVEGDDDEGEVAA